MMGKKPPGTSRRARSAPAMSAAAEKALDREISEKEEELRRVTRQLNLRRAVLLAEQAERGDGPLVEHFADLGQRYAHLVDRGDD